MEPATKKARLTDHFRVALKPRDLNVASLKSKQNRPIEVITISEEAANNHGVGTTATIKQLSRLQQQQKVSNENKAKQLVGQQQEQTLPFKLLTSFSQQPQQQPLQPKPLSQQQQPKQHLGLIPSNTNTNHSQQSLQAKRKSFKSIKGNRSSISNNNSILNNLNGNKSITSYFIKQQQQQREREPSPLNKYFSPPGKEKSLDIFDLDKTLLNNVCWEPHYAWDSFQYDKQQELRFKTTKPLFLIREEEEDEEKVLVETDYNNQNNIMLDDDDDFNLSQHLSKSNLKSCCLSAKKRAELVDWLVDIQINYDLDHEPLYMAVKLVDQYLMRKQVEHGDYELLFMVSMLIAAKFDERIPPITISELIQVTKSRFGIWYSREQVVSFEVDMLTTLQFDIRFPLSYGFLRRFARCTRSDTRTLYLARYILESSLMEQNMIDVIESKIAAGSLLLAFEMLNKNGAWDETAKYYTGYNEQDLKPILLSLNHMLLKFSKKRTSIRKKYSHEPYMEVARIQPLELNCHQQTISSSTSSQT